MRLFTPGIQVLLTLAAACICSVTPAIVWADAANACHLHWTGAASALPGESSGTCHDARGVPERCRGTCVLEQCKTHVFRDDSATREECESALQLCKLNGLRVQDAYPPCQ